MDLIDREKLKNHIKWLPKNTTITVAEMHQIIDVQESVIPTYSQANQCICCGEIIPEGRQVCKKCEVEAE